jgi:hypothetical protein
LPLFWKEVSMSARALITTQGQVQTLDSDQREVAGDAHHAVSLHGVNRFIDRSAEFGTVDRTSLQAAASGVDLSRHHSTADGVLAALRGKTITPTGTSTARETSPHPGAREFEIIIDGRHYHTVDPLVKKLVEHFWDRRDPEPAPTPHPQPAPHDRREPHDRPSPTPDIRRHADTIEAAKQRVLAYASHYADGGAALKRDLDEIQRRMLAQKDSGLPEIPPAKIAKIFNSLADMCEKGPCSVLKRSEFDEGWTEQIKFLKNPYKNAPQGPIGSCALVQALQIGALKNPLALQECFANMYTTGTHGGMRFDHYDLCRVGGYSRSGNWIEEPANIHAMATFMAGTLGYSRLSPNYPGTGPEATVYAYSRLTNGDTFPIMNGRSAAERDRLIREYGGGEFIENYFDRYGRYIASHARADTHMRFLNPDGTYSIAEILENTHAPWPNTPRGESRHDFEIRRWVA